MNPLGYEKIGKLILKFSIPTILSFLISAIYAITDQIYIGRGIGFLGIEGIGVHGMAATGVTFPIVTISTALALLIAVGTAANFNLNLGAGDREKAAKFACNGLLMMACAGLILGVLVFIFKGKLLQLFGVTAEILPLATPYLRVLCLGFPVQIFVVGAGMLIRSDGSPGYSMLCMTCGAITNIILDPILIYGAGLGMAGAALATVLSQCLSGTLAGFYLVKKFKSVKFKADFFKLETPAMRRICALGAAACINQIAMAIVQIVMNNTLRFYGADSIYGSEIPIACVAAISKINVVFLAFVIGIAQGCQPINGYNYGAKNYGRVKQTYITALVAATVFSTLIFLIFQLFPRQVMSIFGQGSEAYFIFSERYLRVYLMLICINGIQPVTSNFFTSIGKARVGIMLSTTRQLVFLVPLLILLPLKFSIDGVVYAGPISDAAAFLLAGFFIIREIRKLDKMEFQQKQML
ncbi:MAG: MATE family efflux transporter [Oscillospiraceae bacterium]|nr:MATE family efflux transporter [Oscillospiraceae bacterium]